MFILTVKGQNLKLYLSVFISVLAVILVIGLVPASTSSTDTAEATETIKKIKENDFENVKTNKDRVNFLKKYGWDVEEEARAVEQVIIPVTFDPIYEKYNELQVGEGLDLEKYKGKTVKRYTFLVNNYEYDGTVLANLLIYKNKVIGGDISSADLDGFVHGLTKGNKFLT